MADYPVGIPEHICDMFEQLTLTVYQRGFDHYSARAILHQIRWHHHVERGDIHFKVNNNFSARLARWHMKRYPTMNGFFETRERSEHNNYGLYDRNDI